MKYWIRTLLLAAALLTFMGSALADRKVSLPSVYLETAFPDGWTVVTPDTAATHAALLGMPAEVAAEAMRSENVIVAAYAPAGTPVIRIRMETDALTALYFDIERYTTAMRAALKAEYLDTEVWQLLGLRFTEAEWKNKSDIGRYLRLTYYRRLDEEIVSRGLMAHTVHNGSAYILEMSVDGRKLSSAEIKLFEQTVNATTYQPQLEMPLLPTGLAFDAPPPLEVSDTAFRLRGTTEPGATVTAYLQFLDDAPVAVGEAIARANGGFTLDVTLPGEGMWQLHIDAALDGFETTRATSRLTCDADQIPINLTQAFGGEIWDAQPRLEGATLKGVTLLVTDGDQTIERRNTDGSFSIKLSPEPSGTRTVTLTAQKAGFPDRTLTYTFERRWHDADYAKYLQDQIERLSYANLIANPAKYQGRLVRFAGMVTSVSSGGDVYYIRLATTEKKGEWTDEMIFVTQEDLLIDADDLIWCYGIVRGDTYSIPLPATEDAQGHTVDLPALTLVHAGPQ